MEHQKMLNLLNEASDSKFLTKKWGIVNDQSNANMMQEMKLSLIQNIKV